MKSFKIWILVLIVALLLTVYLHNLTGWRIFDDEGEYLYQVWRMATAAEMPYRDFMTPQLPVFLYAGAAVMKLTASSLWAMRFYSVLLTFASAGLLFLSVKRHHSLLAGILVIILFLLHPDVFKEMRIFRNEPLFIFFVTAGLVTATWPKIGPERRWLVLSGFSFGMATMVKLFGLLPFGGVGMWLLWDGWYAKRPYTQTVKNLLAFVLPLLLVLLLIASSFAWKSPNFLDLVLGHHLAQGSEQATGEIVQRQFSLVALYARLYPVLLATTLISVVVGFVNSDVRRRWAWQLPTALVLLIVSREFGQRHFMYLLPAIILLASWLLADGLNGRYRWPGRLLSIIAISLILIPFGRANYLRVRQNDTHTQPIVSLIQEYTNPDDMILVDDIGLAFYARRATTYSGAAISHGAISGGQITSDSLINEITESDVRLVIIDVSLLTGDDMPTLRDYPYFHRFLERNFNHIGRFNRDYQELDVWVRDGTLPIQADDNVEIEYDDGTRFGESMALLGYSLPEENLSPGDSLAFNLFWTSTAPAGNYWSIFTHLIGPTGELVGQQDKVSYDGIYPPNRWWPGQIIDDHFAIQIPEDAAAGQYHIVVGMYDWQTGERLQLETADGQPIPDGAVQLEVPIMITK